MLVSNHNSPFKGAVGADVDAEFSNSLIWFSFKNSPNPEYDSDAPENADMSDSDKLVYYAAVDSDNLRVLRIERDERLALTDWRALSDNTLDSDWRVYRQALRDMPQNYRSLDSADGNWPIKPS